MPKICPECQYPNPDDLNECFKCNADISNERFQAERARVAYQRNLERAQQEDRRLREQQEYGQHAREMQISQEHYTALSDIDGAKNLKRLLTVIDVLKWIIFLFIGGGFIAIIITIVNDQAEMLFMIISSTLASIAYLIVIRIIFRWAYDLIMTQCKAKNLLLNLHEDNSNLINAINNLSGNFSASQSASNNQNNDSYYEATDTSVYQIPESKDPVQN